MSARPKSGASAACACGRVVLEATGAPILCAVCYCDDCQEGARRIEALANARPVLDPDGGSAYVIFRKDRVKWSKGAELLQPHKLDARSPTKRIVATCCNSAMLLGFDDAKHWVSVYRTRFIGEMPPTQMHVQTKHRPAGSVGRSDVPEYPGFSLGFIAKLVAARIAMLFYA